MADTWTLKRKLTLTFAAVLLLAATLLAVAVFNFSRMREATGWNTHTQQVMSHGQDMLLNMVNIETGLRGFVASGDDKFLEPLTQGKEAFRKAFDSAKQATADNPSQQARLGKMLASHEGFVQVANRLIELRRDATAGKLSLDALLQEFKAGKDKVVMDAFRAEVASFMQEEAGLLEKRSADLEQTGAVTSNTLIFGGIALCLLTVGLGTLLARSLFRQLGGEPSLAAAIVRSTAEGDLSVHIPLRQGDTDSLMAKMDEMQKSLARTVSSVRSNADGVATASTEIAQGNHDLSGRTEQQASALEETAASMEQLSSTVKQNADSARQANQLAVNASNVATQGGEVVQQVVETMQGINDSSKKIAEIISVIDGIAFQTNILALNAAVEAARAGEQGRGFAVVASEVRSLAGRSAEAAKEIKSLIDASVSQVQQGTGLVAQAGTTMTEVVNSIRRVADLIGEVSAASTEQSQGVAQVGEAIAQMDQVTQQNAALVEESAAAASSLKTQAEQLLASVAAFRLDATTRAVIHAAAAPLAAPARPVLPASAPRAAAAPRPAARKAAPPAVALAPKPAAQPKPATAGAGAEADWETF